MTNLYKLLGISVLALAVALTCWPTTGTAEQKESAPGVEPARMSAPAPGDAPAANPDGATKKVTGTIKSVSGNEVTLADGTKLTIPVTVRVQREVLKPGVAVVARYEAMGGKNIVHWIEVRS